MSGGSEAGGSLRAISTGSARQPRAGAPGRRVGADAARQPAAGAGAARDARAASRREPRRRHGGRAASNYDWMQEFSDQATGHRRHVQADDHRLRRRPRQPERVPRRHRAAGRRSSAPPPSTSCSGSSWPAASSIATRATARRARIGFFAACGRVLLPVPAAGRRCSGSSTRCCSAALHPWLFDRLYPRLTHDMTVERTAFLVRAGALRRVRRRSWPRARWSSTTPRCARSSRIGAACSARSPPRSASSGGNAARGRRVVPAELRALRGVGRRSTRWSRRAPAAPG